MDDDFKVFDDPKFFKHIDMLAEQILKVKQYSKEIQSLAMFSFSITKFYKILKIEFPLNIILLSEFAQQAYKYARRILNHQTP